MPLSEYHMNLDNYFHSTDRKIILNKLSYLELDPNEFKKLLYTQYADTIQILPSCECGHLKGGWLIGKRCPECHTEVINPFDVTKPLLWIESYRDDLKFLNPHFFGQISELITSVKRRSSKTTIDGARWLADTSYRIIEPLPILRTLEGLIGGRGYLNFINNIDRILKYIANDSTFRASGKSDRAKDLLELYEKEKDNLFSNYLPLLNKRLFVMEVTPKGTYTVSMLSDVIDIAYFAVRLAGFDKDKDYKKLANGTARIISSINILFRKYIRTKAKGKKGLVRKHIYGNRSHFTARGVITSLPSHYDYDELHVPWQLGTTLFRPYLVNELYHKHKMSYKDINRLLFKATLKYDPLIDQLLQDMIKRSKYKGIPVLFHRNPTLLQGSSQRLFITKFKTNPSDKTFSFNVMVAKAPNADYDGDEMNLYLLIDEEMIEIAENFSPEKNIISLDYYKVNKYLYMPPTTVATVSNYITEQESENRNCPVYRKLIELNKQ